MLTHLKANSALYSIALVFFALSAGVGTAGYWYYAVQKERTRENTEHQLSTVAELKVHEIFRWRGERVADAEIISDTPSVAQSVKQYFENPESSSLAQEVLIWMRSYADHYDYQSVSLADPRGRTLLSFPEGERDDSELPGVVAEVMRTKHALLEDLERSEAVPFIHIDLIVPLCFIEDGVRVPVGALVLRIDPYRFFYPLIQLWPTPSPTSETLLIRREGEEVVFLSDLRHRENTALSMRMTIEGHQELAAMAGRGYEGTLEGVDYRGHSVLAAIKRVPATSWYLITKVDSDEIYAPVRERALLIGSVLTLMIVGAGVTVGLIWSYQRSRFYLEQYKTEAEKLELAQRYEHLTRNANDIVLLVKQDGTIAEANQRAIATYGYTADELIGLNMNNLLSPECRSDYEEPGKQVRDADGLIFEAVHCGKDGTGFPVEVSLRTIKLMEGAFDLQIIRDITERKLAERSLKEAHDNLEQRVRERTADLLAMNEQLESEIEERIRAQVELRAVTLRLAETEEAERHRLARELHDRVGQNLTALNFNIRRVMDLLRAEPCEETENRIEDSLCLVEETAKCVRDVMTDLRPPLLDDYGLKAALEWYCREFSQRSGIPTAVECEEEIPRPPQSVEIALFRIAQEALINVMRHSQARQVTARLETAAEVVRMTITDDGVGFNPKDTSSPRTRGSGWGMLSMRERAEMIGGSLRVDSRAGSGTSVVVEVAR